MVENHQDEISLSLYAWNSGKFIQHLQVFGFTLIAVSFLYLVAANWFMLPKFAQLAIPQGLLLLSAITSLFLTKNDALVQLFHSICGLMIGLSLAVIGQIYQTGADSYLLFLVWSVLLLPWLYRSNIGVFLLFCVVSQIALFLFFIQTFWGDENPNLFLISIHLFALVQFYFCLKYYPKLRYLFLLYFAILSVWNMVMFLHADKGFIYFVMAFIPLSISLIYFYKQHDQLCSALSALSLGITSTFMIIKWMTDLFRGSDISALFLIALIIFAWFALITFVLMKYIPKSRFNNIPLAGGAWIAGIVLAILMLGFWGNFSLIMGLIFVGFSAFLLKAQQGLFLRQLAYCLFVAGQVAVIFHTFELTEQILTIVILQIIFLMLSYFVRTHWFFLFVQILACYFAGVAFIWEGNDHFHWMNMVEYFSYLILLNYIFYLAMIWVKAVQPQEYQRSLILSVLFIIVFSMGFYTLFGKYELSRIESIPVLVFGLPILWFILFYFLRIQNQFNLIVTLILTILATALIYFGCFEIFICLAVLSWALSQQDKIVYACSLITFAVILWFLYYSLELTFLIKSFSIFISGIILLILTLCLIKFKNKQELNG